ncbi:MAG: hypothetical protein Q8N36_06005, partial [bacterium]|nr:hypothetical protein [bacterium]
MKVKIDFVTNSSSESFGIVIIDTIATTIGVGGGLVLVNTFTNAIFGGAAESAAAIANAAKADADLQDEAIKAGLSEAEGAIDGDKAKIQAEIDSYKKQWEASEKTSDKNDPGYVALKKQYEEYIKSLEVDIQQKDYEKYLIQVAKAEKEAEKDSKNEWNRQRQVDLIAAKEEKALLKATLAGYGAQGYDVKDIETRLKQLDEREKDLTKTLTENDAMIDYTARERGVIGPGKEFDKITKDF